MLLHVYVPLIQHQHDHSEEKDFRNHSSHLEHYLFTHDVQSCEMEVILEV